MSPDVPMRTILTPDRRRERLVYNLMYTTRDDL